MPEGPEAKNMAVQLNSKLQTSILYKIDLSEHYSLCYHRYTDLHLITFPNPLVQVYAYGKKVIFQLNRGYLVFSLGMTGRFGIHPTPGNSDRICLTFMQFVQHPQHMEMIHIYFSDVRKFGNCKFVLDPQIILKNLGPAILGDYLSLKDFLDRCQLTKYANKELVKVLMDQSFLAGIGNYLKSTILYRAKLRPDRTLSSLTSVQKELLYYTIYVVTKEAYDLGGMTIKDYLQIDGRPGTFSSEVYQKEFDPAGHPVLKCFLSDNRTTFWCPAVQI